jgi:hypothetical protein
MMYRRKLVNKPNNSTDYQSQRGSNSRRWRTSPKSKSGNTPSPPTPPDPSSIPWMQSGWAAQPHDVAHHPCRLGFLTPSRPPIAPPRMYHATTLHTSPLLSRVDSAASHHPTRHALPRASPHGPPHTALATSGERKRYKGRERRKESIGYEKK